MLEADEKFFCNSCRCLQEAQKRMKIATLPRVLCLHLKRFKYIEQLDRWASLCHVLSTFWKNQHHEHFRPKQTRGEPVHIEASGKALVTNAGEKVVGRHSVLI